MREDQMDESRLRRLLVVEDDPLVSTMVGDITSVLGYDASFETNGRKALDRLEREQWAYDVIVIDVQLPGMSGWDLARAVRSKQPELPIVIMSGNFTGDVRDRSEDPFGSERVELLAKPFKLRELRAAIDCARRQSRRGGEGGAGVE